jgi:hypothetical protein
MSTNKLLALAIVAVFASFAVSAGAAAQEGFYGEYGLMESSLFGMLFAQNTVLLNELMETIGNVEVIPGWGVDERGYLYEINTNVGHISNTVSTGSSSPGYTETVFQNGQKFRCRNIDVGYRLPSSKGTNPGYENFPESPEFKVTGRNAHADDDEIFPEGHDFHGMDTNSYANAVDQAEAALKKKCEEKCKKIKKELAMDDGSWSKTDTPCKFKSHSVVKSMDDYDPTKNTEETDTWNSNPDNQCSFYVPMHVRCVCEDP